MFPSCLGYGGLGSARGQLRGPVAVRESKNAKKKEHVNSGDYPDRTGDFL